MQAVDEEEVIRLDGGKFLPRAGILSPTEVSAWMSEIDKRVEFAHECLLELAEHVGWGAIVDALGTVGVLVDSDYLDAETL